MATTKTTRLTNRLSGVLPDARKAKGRPVMVQDSEELATGELDASDVVLYDILVPSNGIHESVRIYNDDLDSNACPTLAIDIGLFAAEEFTSVTSGTATKHVADDVLDADILVDGSAEAQSANTDWVRLVPDSATFGPEDAGKAYWEILGYDSDPKTNFRVGVTMATGAATAAAGDLALMVVYTVD